MATNILMPALSPTMTEGTLARWLKKEGDDVRAGDVIAEIETDKATMEVEAVDEGVLSKILVPDGTAGVKVNEPIAVLAGDGEDAAAPAPKVPPAQAPAAQALAAQAPVAALAPAAAATPVPKANGHDPAFGHEGERIFASPLARRMAKQANIDLSSIKGSGPNGRIIRADIEARQVPGTPQPASVEAQAGAREAEAAPLPVQQAKP